MGNQRLTLLGARECPQDHFPLPCDARLPTYDPRFGTDSDVERGGVNNAGLEVAGVGVSQDVIGRGDDSTTCLGNNRVYAPL